jgi:hypothetical protein
MTEHMPDIRGLADDPAAYKDELQRRWTGLLSYRYIGKNSESMNLGPHDDTIRLRHDMRNSAGGVMVAPLAIASPEGCLPDLVAVPNPVVHSVQILDPAYDVERIKVQPSEALHQGRTMGYSRSLILDADNEERVIAYTDGQGISIGVPPEGLEKMDVEDSKIVIEDSPDLPPLWKVFGATKRDDGHWVLPELKLELASPDAALHLGPQHVLLETAAVDTAADLAGTDQLQVQSWHVMFLTRGKVGPFRVDATANRAAGNRIGVRLTTFDEGNAGRAVTSAAGILQMIDSAHQP